MSDLMFCPFCGGKSFIRALSLPNDPEKEIVYVPQCSECGVSGVPVPTIEDAQKMWNRRYEIHVVKETETNGDVVRRMSDEELADRFNDCCPDMRETCPHVLDDSVTCKECVLNWLKKEAPNDQGQR